MERILVTGGTGKLGKEIVKLLIGENFKISVLSSQDKHISLDKVNFIKGDLTKIESLYQIDDNFDIVVHCASNALNSDLVDLEGTHNLLNSIDKGRLKHFIYISIVGVDKSVFQYYQNKFQVEKLINSSIKSWSIIRSTQFHDFVLDRIIKPSDKGLKSHIELTKNMRFQSIDISEVANKVIEIIKAGSTNSITTIGGPGILSIETMVRQYLISLQRDESIELTSTTNNFHNLFTTGINLCPEYTFGKITWEEYIQKIKNNYYS